MNVKKIIVWRHLR